MGGRGAPSATFGKSCSFLFFVLFFGVARTKILLGEGRCGYRRWWWNADGFWESQSILARNRDAIIALSLGWRGGAEEAVPGSSQDERR